MGYRARTDGLARRQKPSRQHLIFCAAVFAVIWSRATTVLAVTPESPEVQRLVQSGLAYLEQHGEDRFGGKCLIGLAFLKAGKPNHPRVIEALEACRALVGANLSDQQRDDFTNYHDGLAVIFLSELSAQAYAREIEWFLARLKARQKPHGGWGYAALPTGDTSQTQYAALAYWEAHRRGFDLNGTSVENLVDWLIRTQGPDGCWGYQGNFSTTGELLPQQETNCSMLAAGLGCLYICADLFGAAMTPSAGVVDRRSDSLPLVLRRVSGPTETRIRKIRAQRTNMSQMQATMERAHGWMAENYRIDIGPKRYYYLYGLERYKSFQEQLEGRSEPEPKWYDDGYRFLAEDQRPDGSWVGFCGAECDTAFSVLFLLRSTQKSLQAKLGEGTLLSGRGLPTNLSRAKLHNGQLIVEQVRTKVDELLSMLEEGDTAQLDELARDPRQLVVETVDEQNARRLQQLVRGGEPEVRLLAVRALGRTGSLDYVPSLLYALTDPDRRVVLEAREGLRFVSRNIAGFGPPDDFTDAQRYEALDAWKKWYQSLRPTAVLEP